MKVTSPVFEENESIPIKYTADAENLSPPLHIEDIPRWTKSLALMVEDPDAPNGVFHHWILFNMNPRTTDIGEGTTPVIATQGKNDFGDMGYGGPKPPSGEHHYFFNVYALDTVLNLPRGTKADEFEEELKGHVLDQASLMGRYAHNGGRK